MLRFPMTGIDALIFAGILLEARTGIAYIRIFKNVLAVDYNSIFIICFTMYGFHTIVVEKITEGISCSFKISVLYIIFYVFSDNPRVEIAKESENSSESSFPVRKTHRLLDKQPVNCDKQV